MFIHRNTFASELVDLNMAMGECIKRELAELIEFKVIIDRLIQKGVVSV